MNTFDRKAFTLIELLIVVAIIAILAAIAVPNFLEAQTRSKVSRARTDLRTATTALEAYAVDFNKYPPEMRPRQGMFWGYGGVLAYHGRTGHSPARERNFEVMRTLSVSLTTPVAYISSIMPDPFKINRSIQSGNGTVGDFTGLPYETGNPFDSTFNYHNIKMRVDGIQAGYLYDDLKDYGDWRMFSIGPMGLWWAIGTGDTSMGWKYDPTNGTMSSGFILRTQKDTSGENFSRS